MILLIFINDLVISLLEIQKCFINDLNILHLICIYGIIMINRCYVMQLYQHSESTAENVGKVFRDVYDSDVYDNVGL